MMLSRALVLIMLAALVLSACTPGCVKVSRPGEKEPLSGQSEEVPLPQVKPQNEQAAPPAQPPVIPVETPVAVTTTPYPGSSVTDSLPDLPPDPYQVPNGSVPESIESGRAILTPIYHASFADMRNESRGLLVDVVTPPLRISYTVTKRNWADYKGKPLSDNPRWSYFVVTVRDNATRQLLGEDGFGYVYSTDEKKEMYFYRQGTYHLTFTGNMVDATIMVSTGDAPDQVRPLVTPTPVPPPPDEELPVG
jgi:hypothetical protein